MSAIDNFSGLVTAEDMPPETTSTAKRRVGRWLGATRVAKDTAWADLLKLALLQALLFAFGSAVRCPSCGHHWRERAR